MAQGIAIGLIVVGAIFMLLAAVGVVRMPDVYMRMHSSTKSATFGVSFVMAGTALYFGDFAIAVRALAVVVFFFITAPVAAHLIGRAAYVSGVPLWPGTLGDELRGCYDREAHRLNSTPQPEQSAAER
ncbi:MAG TPA: monovalent cation/H(+) antiporter subunit G [Anaerolineales bacterium]|nr:monovalent cation/H(+) antiporter subunit G [Anaerolineales bacterium]HRF50677.1 monovalent cation/H(+) antiporter subunit G [Anaerolineales bacterium]